MSLFVNEVMSSPWLPTTPGHLVGSAEKWRHYRAGVVELLRTAVPFEITNVADFLYTGTSREVWDLFEDFPRPMPPFAHTWLEWTPCRWSNSNGTMVQLEPGALYRKVGCLVSCEPALGIGPVAKYRVNALPFYLARHVKFRDGMDTDVLLAGTVCVFGLDAEGNPVGVNPQNQLVYYFPGLQAHSHVASEDQDRLAALGKDAVSSIFPACLALSLVNCRNASTTEIRMPEALRRKHAKFGRLPAHTSHRVIEIQPIKNTIAAATGEGQAAGYSRRAAAIVRGHFKDYSAGKGLFGKLKGLYFWPQQFHGQTSAEYRLKGATGPLDSAFRDRVKR